MPYKAFQAIYHKPLFDLKLGEKNEKICCKTHNKHLLITAIKHKFMVLTEHISP